MVSSQDLSTLPVLVSEVTRPMFLGGNEGEKIWTYMRHGYLNVLASRYVSAFNCVLQNTGCKTCSVLDTESRFDSGGSFLATICGEGHS